MRQVDYVTHGFGGLFSDFGYLFSPTGGSLLQRGKQVFGIEEVFGGAVSRLIPFGLNPRFIDIIRGPNGRQYLTQAIRFLDTYQANLSRYKGNINAAYNNTVAMVGTSSPLTPSKEFLSKAQAYLGSIDSLHRAALSYL